MGTGILFYMSEGAKKCVTWAPTGFLIGMLLDASGDAESV